MTVKHKIAFPGWAKPWSRCRRREEILSLAIALALSAAHAQEAPRTTPSSSLEPIDIAARKLPVETLIDRKIYSVSADLQSTFGTISDVLGAIPSVEVDPDGIVSLRGDSNVLILIDGKPSALLTGPTAGENLQSMQASTVDRIEVITTPPAQFKADGAAGIINIITRHQHDIGLAGTIQGSVGNGGRAVFGSTTSYSDGPLIASATVGIRHDYRRRVLSSDVRAPDPVTAQLLDSTSNLNETIHRDVPSVGLAGEYALSDTRSVSGSANWTKRGGLRTYVQNNEGTESLGAPVSASRRLSRGHDPEGAYDETLGFAQKVGPAGELSLIHI